MQQSYSMLAIAKLLVLHSQRLLEIIKNAIFIMCPVFLFLLLAVFLENVLDFMYRYLTYACD